MMLSIDVCTICRISEKIIRQYSNKLLQRGIKYFLMNQIFSQISILFFNNVMNEHVLSQDLLDNHRTQLCKYVLICRIIYVELYIVIELLIYINIRLFHEAKQIRKGYVRSA